MNPSETPDHEMNSPAEAFSAVASKPRFEILEVLFEAGNDGLSFSEIRERTGIQDSGQFNYHLGQLLDTFVTKTGDAYQLKYAGKQLIGAVLAGVYSTETYPQTLQLDQQCRLCGNSLVGSYMDEVLKVYCSDCGEVVSKYHTPPGLLDPYDPEELPQIVDRWFKLQLVWTAAGFCSRCLGPLSAEIGHVDSEFAESLAVQYMCDRCGYHIDSIIGAIVLNHPAVVSFHYQHGIDLSETPIWGLEWLFESHASEIADPAGEVAISITLQDEMMTLVIDENAQVVSTERTAV